jgi:hypothetical protein
MNPFQVWWISYIKQLPMEIIDRIVKHSDPVNLKELLSLWIEDCSHRAVIVFQCIPKHHPMLVTSYNDNTLLQLPFIFTPAHGLSQSQAKFLQMVLSPPYNCIIAGGFCRRMEPHTNDHHDGHPSEVEGDIDVFIPSDLDISNVLHCMETCFDNSTNMVYVSRNFFEIYTVGNYRNIQLIQKPIESNGDTMKFALAVCNGFDFTYTRSAIWYEPQAKELVWACTPSYQWAMISRTTMCTKTILTRQRKSKTEKPGFEIVSDIELGDLYEKRAYSQMHK